MKLHQLTPMLKTPNLAQTIQFYETVLQAEAKTNFPNFAAISLQGLELMFVQPDEYFDGPQFSGNIYIFMEGIDELWQLVKDKATVKEPIANRTYLMRDFCILDNNGYELVFGEDISKKQG